MGKTAGAFQYRLLPKVVTYCIKLVRLGERPKPAQRSFLEMRGPHLCESLLRIESNCRHSRGFFLTIYLHIQLYDLVAS